jgi:hypothetical protein
LVLSLVFVAAYVLIGVFSSLSPLTLLLGLSVFAVLGVQILGTKLALSLKRGHIRFVPIRISARAPVPAPWFILPFALVSLAVLFFSGTDTIQAELAGWEGLPLVNASDYAEHIRFQRSFSYLPLKADDRSNRSYHSYTLDSEGLIAGAVEASSVLGTVLAAEDYTDGPIPPFPLTELMMFLAAQAYETPSIEVSEMSPKELFPSVLILGLSMPLFLHGWHRRRKNGKLSIYIDKRIAA